MSGVTARVWAPPGVDVGPVEITATFGGDRVLTAEYAPGSGTLLKHHFPHLHGNLRTENLDVTLRERGPDGPLMYSMEQAVTIRPQFDITFSRLTGDIDGRCDLIGSPDPTVFWMDANGVQHRHDRNGGFLGFWAPGMTWDVEGFATTVRRASLDQGPTLPTFEWYDRDPRGSIGEPGLPRGPRLLPRPDSPAGLAETVLPVRTPHLPEADGDGCTASFSYTIHYRPVLG
jgi:hypothetical protein